MTAAPALFGVSDLHVGFPANRDLVTRLRPEHPGSWLIVAGDVGEVCADIEWALGTLREQYARVLWAPGNHELWSHRRDPVRLRGEERYQHLVGICRRLDVDTPEDPYPLWSGPGGPAVIAPLFVLYDYSFRPDGAATKEQALQLAYASGVVCNDERLLHPDPYPSREAWCDARVTLTERRLAAAGLPGDVPVVLAAHWPLIREPTRVLRHPPFAQWCGTDRTADWPARFGATAVVYGHLHIPRTITKAGIRHEEVSLGYPREWTRRAAPPRVPRQILPAQP